MSYKDDCKGTSESEFRVGMAGGGQRIISVFNGFLARMLWNPTAARDIIIPDADGTIVLQNGNRISGLLPAIANGQAATFEQLATGSTAQYEGVLEYRIVPANTTAIATVGGSAPTTAGTISTPTQAVTSHVTATRRTVLTGAATAGTLTYIRSPALLFWRGNAANRGGFRLVMRFATETLVAGQRGFFGLSSTGASNPTNVDPITTTAGSKIGIAFNNNTGNLQLIRNVNGTAPTVLDLGANFPINTTNLYELVLAALPNASGIDYAVTNKATGTTSTGTFTTNIPTATEFLAPIQWMTNNATAAAFAFSNAGIILTTPN